MSKLTKKAKKTVKKDIECARRASRVTDDTEVKKRKTTANQAKSSAAAESLGIPPKKDLKVGNKLTTLTAEAINKPNQPTAQTAKTVRKQKDKSNTKKTARRRKPHATRPTPKEKIEIGERRELVIDLSAAGCSIRQISKHLKQKGFRHFSPATVFADLEAELEARRQVRLKKTDLLVELELVKIDDWELTVSPSFKTTRDVNIGYFLVTLQNQRDKYLNISKKQKSEIKANEALAKLLGVSVEEIPVETNAK